MLFVFLGPIIQHLASLRDCGAARLFARLRSPLLTVITLFGPPPPTSHCPKNYNRPGDRIGLLRLLLFAMETRSSIKMLPEKPPRAASRRSPRLIVSL